MAHHSGADPGIDIGVHCSNTDAFIAQRFNLKKKKKTFFPISIQACLTQRNPEFKVQKSQLI